MRLIRLTTALAAPTVRAVNWTPMVVASAVLALLALAVYGLVDGLRPNDALTLQRSAALVYGIAAAFALSDAMAANASALPVARWLRQGVRAALALGIAAVAWTALLLAAAVRLPGQIGAAAAGLATEAAVCVTVGLLGAAVAQRRTPGPQAALGGPALLLVFLGTTAFQRGTWHPWPALGSPHWDAVHGGWLAVLPLLLLALAVANREVR